MRHDKSFQNCIEIWCVRVTRVAAYVNKCRRRRHHKGKTNSEETHGREFKRTQWKHIAKLVA
jgi:hypothetical protein